MPAVKKEKRISKKSKTEIKKLKHDSKKSKTEITKEKHDLEKSKTEICSQKKVAEAINTLKLLEERFVENELKKQPLLENTTESLVFLQIILKKIPPPQLIKMIGVSLPHSLITETSEVCLITGDLEKRNHKAEIEPTVLFYKDLLKKNGVTNVAQVIPLRQLRTEYKTFESKRQLAAAYDVFLVDKKIAGVVPKTLGKSFFQGRKFPIQIDMKRLNLKEQINKALSQTKFSLACRGNSYALEIARLSMENDAILENIMASIEVLADKIPGKENNILSLYLKTAKSKAIPIYLTLDISDDILIKKPRKNVRAELDELSTMDDAQVKVFRDGRVILRKAKKNSNAAEEETNLNEPSSGDVLSENEENTQESTANEVSLKKKKKSKKSHDLIEIADEAELENEDKTSPKKKKKGKKSISVDHLADNSQVEFEEVKDSITTETPSKKKKKKNKNNMNSSHVEAGEALEDVSEIEYNGEINKNRRSKKHRISQVVEEDIKVKTPKSKKEKKAKDVISVEKEETSLIFIEDEETMQNEKTPSRSKKGKKESTGVFITPTPSSMSKRKNANEFTNNLDSSKRQKRHSMKTKQSS